MSGPVNEARLPPPPVGLRLELFVQDVEASVRFYRSTLGLEPPATWSPSGYVPIHAGTVIIGVQHLANLPADHHFSAGRLAGPRGVGLEIVIEVDDIDLAYATAASHAEPCGGHVEPLADQPWGLRDFRLVDPDGYYVRITSHRR
jgi:catechol 2,3-dioxygenase-like lactoylglutathione lyase family enzyme